MADEITSKILIEIRDEVRGLKSDMGEVKSDIGGLKTEVAELRRDFTILTHLTRGIDTRLGHVEEDVRELRATAREQAFLGRRVSVLEEEAREFRSTTERRLDALEAKQGSD